MRWGPEPAGGGRWRFALWAPALQELVLEFDGRPPLAMQPAGEGWFAGEAEAEPGARYRFRVSDSLAVPDPASRAQAKDVHGWSVLVDPHAYSWRCGRWGGRPWEEAVIYELHAGLLGGFTGVARELPRLADLGVTAVELMPVADFSGSRNWGYDGVLPYAPGRAYGSPGELKALVDRAHELELMVLLDVVYNHFGPEGNYIAGYAPDFFHPEVQTPWGAAIAFDREPVRRFFLDNALMWLEEYRFDGLRFDAVHAIGDTGFLDAMAAEIRARVAPDRHVHLVLENEANDADRLTRGYDAQWSDDFHNAVHVILTAETNGYYAGFADDPTDRLARCLREGFAYQGEPAPGADRPRGMPSGHLPPMSFVSFLQNHDQVGNRAFGERLILLTERDRLRAATALLLLSPQIPLLFMGEEQGSTCPFLYFTDFHDELAGAVREGRRSEFAGFPAFADPERRRTIPDPNAHDTFDRSRPRPGPAAAEWECLYRELLALRMAELVPRLAEMRALSADAAGEGAVLARWRYGAEGTYTIFVNLGSVAVDTPPLPIGRPIFALGEAGAAGSFAAWLDCA